MKRGAFSLVEILAALAIILVVAAMIFAGASGAARKARETDEAVRLRQIYTALCLYEADNDQKPPASLIDLAPAYLPTALLANPRDARMQIKSDDWPANPWVNSWVVDPPLVSNRRSKTVVSYAYLKTFEARFLPEQTWESLRQNPTIGLIAGLGLFTCQPPDGSGCSYPVNKIEMDKGQPSPNLAGTFLTVRTDGSIATRMRPAPAASTMSLESLFFFEPLVKAGNQSVKPN